MCMQSFEAWEDQQNELGHDVAVLAALIVPVPIVLGTLDTMVVKL